MPPMLVIACLIILFGFVFLGVVTDQKHEVKTKAKAKPPVTCPKPKPITSGKQLLIVMRHVKLLVEAGKTDKALALLSSIDILDKDVDDKS